MGLNIKNACKVRGLTLAEVADRMGISVVGLSKHVNGNPSVAVLERIAAAIGCKVVDLFDDESRNYVTCPHCGGVIEVRKPTE